MKYVEKYQKFSTGVFHSPVDKSLMLWIKLCVDSVLFRCHSVHCSPRWRFRAS